MNPFWWWWWCYAARKSQTLRTLTRSAFFLNITPIVIHLVLVFWLGKKYIQLDNRKKMDVSFSLLLTFSWRIFSVLFFYIIKSWAMDFLYSRGIPVQLLLLLFPISCTIHGVVLFNTHTLNSRKRAGTKRKEISKKEKFENSFACTRLCVAWKRSSWNSSLFFLVFFYFL